eukprot:3696155-Rhodomonas_salina.2
MKKEPMPENPRKEKRKEKGGINSMSTHKMTSFGMPRKDNYLGEGYLGAAKPIGRPIAAQTARDPPTRSLALAAPP